jgi:hypothetical protein
MSDDEKISLIHIEKKKIKFKVNKERDIFKILSNFVNM